MAQPSSAEAAKKSPWLIEITAADNALAPVITKNETVGVDCSERDLVDGGIYAVKTGDEVALWLFHEGFAGMGVLASGEDVGTLASLAGGFRCSGPLAIESVKVIGRLASDIQPTDIGRYASERSLLVAALDECRNAIRRHTGGLRELQWHEAPQPADSLAKWRKRFDDLVADKEASKRFALEQRIDALNARLMFLEECIANSEAKSHQDVATKLRVLWDLHHAPFPATHGDLAARIVATALNGLESQDNQASTANNEGAASSGGPAIKLVSSPRRR